MKIPTWLRWSAVAMSAFLAGFYVAYASGYMRQASYDHVSDSTSDPMDEVIEEWSMLQRQQSETTEAADSDVMFSSSKFGPIFVPQDKGAPQAERVFIDSTKRAAIFTDDKAQPSPPPPILFEPSSKAMPPSPSKGAK